MIRLVAFTMYFVNDSNTDFILKIEELIRPVLNISQLSNFWIFGLIDQFIWTLVFHDKILFFNIKFFCFHACFCSLRKYWQKFTAVFLFMWCYSFCNTFCLFLLIFTQVFKFVNFKYLFSRRLPFLDVSF